MPAYVAFLRGINVGGTGKLPMKELIALLEGLGATGVRTYIQSGNAVFTSPAKDAAKLGARLTAAIEAARGFAPHVLVLTAAELEKAAQGNPYPEAVATGNRLFLGFLAAKPAKPDTAKLAALKSPTERFTLKDRVFYFHAPDGVGRSKLAAGAERAIGVPMTLRNWQTVTAVLALAQPLTR
jgi:uncharacterized protein (DUF1697 family)